MLSDGENGVLSSRLPSILLEDGSIFYISVRHQPLPPLGLNPYLLPGVFRGRLHSTLGISWVFYYRGDLANARRADTEVSKSRGRDWNAKDKEGRFGSSRTGITIV